MNQILSVSDESKKSKRQPTEISKVVKFFAISIAVLGFFLIGTGSYAIYKNGQDLEAVATKPIIEEENKDENTILLKVMHDKEIATVEYYWNDEEPNVIKGNGRKYIEQQIEVPGGLNTLNVKAIDINGEETFFPKEYETEENVHIEVAGKKLKITAELETPILYMTYRWDEEQETKVDINNQTLDQEIDIPLGDHKLTVILVDENNETIKKEQKVKGVTIPTVDVKVDDPNNPQNYLITISDEVGLERVEFTINGEKLTKTIDNNDKEAKFKLKLTSGENRLEIIAYNTQEMESKPVKVKAAK